ncbi:MAG TPA: zf-HC2 domain-containing protein, partial [Gemmatimonadales bacterium]
MHPEWIDQLSAYLDGELPPEPRGALEAHLAVCAPCRSVLQDLKTIVAAAPRYTGSVPGQDLWPAIRRAIDAGREVELRPRQPPAQRLFTLRQLVAASIVFAMVTGGAVYYTVGRAGPPAAPMLVQQAPVVPGPTGLPVSARAGAAFDLAVGELEQVLAQGRSRLEPKTLKIIEDNLQVIDRA